MTFQPHWAPLGARGRSEAESANPRQSNTNWKVDSQAGYAWAPPWRPAQRDTKAA